MWLVLLACVADGGPLELPLRDGVISDTGFAGCGCIGTRCDLRHLGVDLDAPIGTEVFAVGAGEVLYRAGPGQETGWGDGAYALFVRHDAAAGPFVAVYGHVVTDLVEGDAVSGGEAIATVADYHETFGGVRQRYPSHLHFGVHPGADLPDGPTGLLSDPYCDGTTTAGFVAPIAFLRSRTPANRHFPEQDATGSNIGREPR